MTRYGIAMVMERGQLETAAGRAAWRMQMGQVAKSAQATGLRMSDLKKVTVGENASEKMTYVNFEFEKEGLQSKL